MTDEAILIYEEKKEEEQKYKGLIKSLRAESNTVKDNYYKAMCGDKYDEIYNLLNDIYTYMGGDKSVLKQQEQIFETVTKSLDKLVSKKVLLKTEIKSKDTYSYGNDRVALGYYGLALGDSYRVRKVNGITDLITIFKETSDLHKHVWKKDKKELIKVYQKELSNMNVFNLNKYNFDFGKDYKILKEDKDNIYGLTTEETELSMRFGRYSNNGIVHGRYYGSLILVDFKKPITNYNCFLVSQVYDVVKDKLIDLKDTLKLEYNNNNKIWERVMKSIRHLLVADML